MSFISYAGSLQDIMLYRALKSVERGFYIDVGACLPVVGSVTKAFYDRGWHGINIEPQPECFHLLQQHRPADTNLNLSVGSHQGDMVLYEIINCAGFATSNKFYADRYAAAGHKVRTHSIPCTTLDAICTEYRVDTIHFLNIDVEGAELSVLKGFSFLEVRPWILAIEATEPNTLHDVSGEWEPYVLGKDYRFVYFDGVNRFYVASEHAELEIHFKVPPNPFDDYITYGHWLASTQLQEVYSSFSWRITAPLRIVGRIFKPQKK